MGTPAPPADQHRPGRAGAGRVHRPDLHPGHAGPGSVAAPPGPRGAGQAARRVVHRRLLLGHRIRRPGPGAARPRHRARAVPRHRHPPRWRAGRPAGRSRQPPPPVRRGDVRGHRAVRPGHVQRAEAGEGSWPPPGSRCSPPTSRSTSRGSTRPPSWSAGSSRASPSGTGSRSRRKPGRACASTPWTGGTSARPPTGTPPQRVPHPVPVKAAQGRTKTRLVLDPLRAAGGGADLHLARRRDRLGISTITNRLNADHDTYPPPKGDTWTLHGVYAHPGQPQIHRAHGLEPPPHQHRTAAAAASTHPSQWLWSPEPPTRRSSPASCRTPPRPSAPTATPSAGEPGQPAHPLARRTYVLRSLDPPPRLQAADVRRHPRRPAVVLHCARTTPTNPRHAAAVPDHPRTVTIREDHLLNALAQFLDERIFGPERAAPARQPAARHRRRRRRPPRQAGRRPAQAAAPDRHRRERPHPGNGSPRHHHRRPQGR